MNRYTSISLASELPDNEAVLERQRIIGNLLFLSNELHGSGSAHLFVMNPRPNGVDAQRVSSPEPESNSSLQARRPRAGAA